MLSDAEVQALRSHFPILREKTYLYSNSHGALSDAVEEGFRQYLAVWRSSKDPWNEWMAAYEALRREFAAFINASPDEVAIVTSASAGINAIASALQFDRRNKVVLTEYEFPTMSQIWLAQQARGAEIQFLNSSDGIVPLECYETAIDERTLIVPFTQVCFSTGVRSDVCAVTRIAHDNGALVFLDGYQDCGTRPVDVRSMGVDFYVTGALKYLLGPPGLAFLYVRRELVEGLVPTVTSWMAQRAPFAFEAKRFDPAPDARRFEGGTPPVPNIYMARQALDLLVGIGMENVAAQVARLTGAFLQEIGQLSIASKTPLDSTGPLAVVRSTAAGLLVERLAERGIVGSARHYGVRLAFHVYNTQDDVQAAIEGLRANLDLVARL
jgi:selenocysteine lyase/cysteine desulfurase